MADVEVQEKQKSLQARTTEIIYIMLKTIWYYCQLPGNLSNEHQVRILSTTTTDAHIDYTESSVQVSVCDSKLFLRPVSIVYRHIVRG